MKLQHCTPSIRIHRSFLCYLAFLWLLNGGETVCAFLAVLTIHEAAHLFAGILLGEAFERILLTPFGGVITYQAGKSACKGLRGMLIAAAGPAANFALVLLCSCVPVQGGTVLSVLRMTVIISISMFFINLLPVLPLDGGRIAFSIGYYLFSVGTLASILGGLGVLTGGVLILLAIYGLTAYGTLNITMIIVGAYMIVCSESERRTLLANELFTILEERQHRKSGIRPIRLYAMEDCEKLLCLAEQFHTTKETVCVYDFQARRVIHEDALISALLSAPQQTLREAFPVCEHPSSSTI